MGEKEGQERSWARGREGRGRGKGAGFQVGSGPPKQREELLEAACPRQKGLEAHLLSRW